jgi:hypothetical protein
MPLKSNTPKRASKPAKKAPVKKAGAATKAAAAARRTVPKVSPLAGKTVDAYVAGLAPPMASIVQALRPISRAEAPGAAEVVKWAQAVYEQGGPLIYIKAHTSHVTFGFWRGAMLSDPAGLLSGDGDRMKSMKLRTAADINAAAIAALVRQAVALDQTLGDPTRGN